MFLNYAQDIFLKSVLLLQDITKIDIIFEEYPLDSLNATARGKHGKGVRRFQGVSCLATGMHPLDLIGTREATCVFHQLEIKFLLNFGYIIQHWK